MLEHICRLYVEKNLVLCRLVAGLMLNNPVLYVESVQGALREKKTDFYVETLGLMSNIRF